MSQDHPSAEVVDRVAELLKSRIGLRPDPFLRSRLGRSIRDEAAQHKLDVEDYLQTLFVTEGALQSLLNRVTVQETGFFRHPEHFQVLAHDVLPTLAQPIRIWSAGCANGQEAFSLAMLLEEQGIDGSVIATDLSTQALERTSAARYAPRELTGLSPARIARHLTETKAGWQINESLRERVVTVRHNLMSPLPDQVRSSRSSSVATSSSTSRLSTRRPFSTGSPTPCRRPGCSSVPPRRCGPSATASKPSASAMHTPTAPGARRPSRWP